MDESGYAAYLQDIGTGAIFSENFSSIRSVFSSPLAANKKRKNNNNNKKANMPPHMNPKTYPGVF